MAIRPEEVRRIAELARLEIPEERVAVVAAQLSRVLDFVATLETLDLSADRPETLTDPESALRDDVANGRRLGSERATAGAPEAEPEFFVVPPIVENVNP